MNSRIVISSARGWGFQPILYGKCLIKYNEKHLILAIGYYGKQAGI
ncbi:MULTISPECIES: hypothetical protein [unclassified Microcoleus]|nr:MULTISPECIES: hypothetical protein [unclassified Microcoleus]